MIVLGKSPWESRRYKFENFKTKFMHRTFFPDFYCAAVPRVRETNFKISRGENFRLIREYRKVRFLNSYSRKTRNHATFFDPMTSEMLKR